MRKRKTGKITLIVAAAFALLAIVELSAISGRISNARDNLDNLRVQVVRQELINAELEHALENYNNPDFIAEIARTHLGLVQPGEIVFYTVD